MTMTELAELILTRLYELANEQGREKLHDINEIAKSFRETDVMKVHRAVQFLESKNFIKAFCDQHALCRGFINYIGENYVDSGGETGIISKYKSNPSVFYIGNYVDKSISISDSALKEVNISTHSSNMIQSINSNSEIESLLREITTKLKNDPSLPDAEKNDLLLDVDSIKNELHKRSIDKPTVKSKLDVLAKVSSIGSLVINLAKLILS